MPSMKAASASKILVGSGRVPILEGADAALVSESAERGVFLRVRRETPSARFVVGLGKPLGWRRMVALFREEPFWMRPCVETRVERVPVDTQLLFVELEQGGYAVVVPLVKGLFRASLQGRVAKPAAGAGASVGDGELTAVLQTGDPQTLGGDALVAYVAVGEDPFELAEASVREVGKALGTFDLRGELKAPAFADRFGWCTWDAFYQEVSHEKVREGLQSFRDGGVEPRFLILDDGWQSVAATGTGETRLTGFDANDKFPEGLRGTVTLAKDQFSVDTFFVWHAVYGYWGGLSNEVFARYGAQTSLRWFSPETLKHWPAANWDWWGAAVGRPDPDALGQFYDAYHAALASEGVDGVKVDNQACIEGLVQGVGSRVEVAEKTRRALEASVEKHFGGELIACMSCSNDLLLQTRSLPVFRSSVDFWPNKPESHGAHAYANAWVSVWFGRIGMPDWDMFQSGHAAGRFHAALRAVSGGPVYVSDRPGAHDFALLKQLVLSDGTVLRASQPGQPTRDCLFVDPQTEAVLLKIWNVNRRPGVESDASQGSTSGVVGVFHARYRAGEPDPIEGSVGVSDVPGLEGDEFALYLHEERRLVLGGRDARVMLTLATLEAELVTIVPVQRGVAALGLVNQLNGAAAITEAAWRGPIYRVALRDGGTFGAFSARKPKRIRVDGRDATDVDYDGSLLRIRLAAGGARVLELDY